jgi:hypothetical protein
VRVLFHMNMPSGSNDLVHQVIGEVPHRSIGELAAALHHQSFITIDYVSYERQKTGEKKWRSRGEMLLNTAHIGKVAEYYEG